MTPVRRTMLVALLAVLGIVLAAAITWGTSQLVRQHIGLSSEPLTAGRSLLPPLQRSRTSSTGGRTTPAPSTTTSTTTPTTPTTPTTTAPPAYTQPTTTAPPTERPTPRAEPPAGGRERSGDGGGDSRARGDD